MELKNRALFFPMTALKEWGLRSGVTNVIEIMESHLDNFEQIESQLARNTSGVNQKTTEHSFFE
jgi:hypothetical protein